MELLDDVRDALRDDLRVATTLGYGPRFLHSTGQFHKGGPNTGVFIQITADEAHEARSPAGIQLRHLIRAQALGDLQRCARTAAAWCACIWPSADGGRWTRLERLIALPSSAGLQSRGLA